MSSPTILLVDDEPQITYLVARKLQQSGFNTVIGTDGEEGLQLAIEHQVDMVITDLQMPYMSGIEMAQSLRKEPSLNQIPIIILTARGYVMDRAEIEDAKISRVIPKPFSVEELIKCVRTLLELPVPADIRDAA